jgi:hypothetical protein
MGKVEKSEYPKPVHREQKKKKTTYNESKMELSTSKPKNDRSS